MMRVARIYANGRRMCVLYKGSRFDKKGEETRMYYLI
jgi:hypothetical protein